MEPSIESPRRVIEQMYAAMASKDLETIQSLLDPAVVIEQDPALPWGGRFEGPEGFGQFTVALIGTIDSVVTTEALFQPEDDVVVQFGRTAGTVRATGAAFDLPECHVWTVRAGRATAAHFYIDTQAMLAALSR